MSNPAEAPSAPPAAPNRPNMPDMCYACGRHLAPEMTKCPDCGAPVRSAKARRGFDRLSFAAFVLALLALIGGWGGIAFLSSTDEIPAGDNPILESRVHFSGSVFNESEAALSGVMVYVGDDRNDTRNATTTGDNGTFALLDVPTGYHLVTFAKENYTTVQMRVYLFSDETTTVRLMPGNGTETRDHGTYRMMVLGLNFCGSIVLGAAIFSLAGALACYRRRNYGLALAASIVSIFVVPVMILAILLWILALVLVVRSKRDFR